MKKTKETYLTVVNIFIKFVNWLFGETTKDHKLTANTIVKILMNEETTEKSILLFEEAKKKFEAELTKIKTLAIMEKSSVDFYFKKPIKEESQNIKTIYEIINN